MIQYPCVSLNHAVSISDISYAILCYITFGLSGPVIFLFISCKRHSFQGAGCLILHEMRTLIYPTNLPENFSISLKIQHDRV